MHFIFILCLRSSHHNFKLPVTNDLFSNLCRLSRCSLTETRLERYFDILRHTGRIFEFCKFVFCRFHVLQVLCSADSEFYRFVFCRFCLLQIPCFAGSDPMMPVILLSLNGFRDSDENTHVIILTLSVFVYSITLT